MVRILRGWRLVALTALTACGPHAVAAIDAGSRCGECPAGMACDEAAGICRIEGCGNHLSLAYVPPNLGLVLDRSCSMTEKLTGTATTKWQAAVGALRDVLATYGPVIRWGLTLFPDITNAACTQDAIPIPIGDANATPIDTLLGNALGSADPLFPDGPCQTNIDTGIEQAATDPALADPARTSFLLLVTDGEQSACAAGGGNAGTEAAIGALHARGVATFVVGFGSEVNATELDKLASLGGVAQVGEPQYYQADTAVQLGQAFQTIAGLVVSCSYKVDPPPPDVDQTYVFYDHSEPVPRDAAHGNGWDYDPATETLTFYGAYCDRIKSHAVTDLDVVFGCPIP